jgi:intracellular sulfur oxidation DsrE/DsrF family protein
MPANDFILLLTRQGMGNGPQDLQLQLLGKYLQLLLENEDLPAAICFYTDGVKLVTEDSSLVDIFHSLEQKGVRLIACSTCLNYYGLLSSLKAGIAGSMADILDAQLKAQKVISL